MLDVASLYSSLLECNTRGSVKCSPTTSYVSNIKTHREALQNIAYTLRMINLN